MLFGFIHWTVYSRWEALEFVNWAGIFEVATLVVIGAVWQPGTYQGAELSMSKQEEAGLILKLYELRRDPTMRIARDWYFREFNPQTFADFQASMMGEHTGHLRMVVTYWDMAAALVNHGAIGLDIFNDSNGEHIGVFSKIEPLLGEIRSGFGPLFAANLEKLIDAIPNGRQRAAASREQMKAIRAMLAKQAGGAAQ